MTSRAHPASGCVLLGALLVLPSPSLGAFPGTAPGPPFFPVPKLQEPPRPDTLPADTLRPEAPEPDTLEVPDDFQEVRQVVPRNLPLLPGGVPSLHEAGVWEWDRDEILGSEALTLYDLLTWIPGIIPLRGGDYGTPVAVTSGGLGPGQVRVFRDGIEEPPLEGGVVDLSQVGLTGLEAVRVERGPGELRIHLETLRLTDARPYTLLDVGTGDLRTNLFRATFAHPAVMGGTLLVSLDRLDTEGDRQENEGAAFGSRFRYALFRGERGGVAVDYRRRTSQRPEGIFEPEEVKRSDLTIHGSWMIREHAVVEGYYSGSGAEPGRGAPPEAELLLPGKDRRQAGVRLGTEVGPGWIRGEAGARWGDGWPGSILGLEAGTERGGIGGVHAAWQREGWRDAGSGRAVTLRGWTAPRRGISLFGEFQDARRGVPYPVPSLPPDEVEDLEEETEEEGFPTVRFHDRSGLRAGARARWRGLDLSAAYLLAEADSLAPMGLPFDREGFTTPAGRRTGVEVAGLLPLDRVLTGLRLEGHGQLWEEGPSWRYLPERSWLGAVQWRHLGYDGNLQIWTDVGLRGRDAMSVPVLVEDGDAFFRAPVTQSWFARLQIRVVTVRLFVIWENFTIRDDNMEFPGRPQPRTRALYGIRWTMWN